MIYFNVPGPRAFLACKGYVYTVRKRYRRVGPDTAVFRGPNGIEKIGRVKIDFTRAIFISDELRPYVSESGTGNVGEAQWDRAEKWFELAKKLHQTESTPFGLYRVELI